MKLFRSQMHTKKRVLSEVDINIMHQYKLALVDYLLFEDVSQYEGDKILAEIKDVAIFVRDNDPANDFNVNLFNV